MTHSELANFDKSYTEWTLTQLRQRAYEEGIDHNHLTIIQLIARLEQRDRDRTNAPFDV